MSYSEVVIVFRWWSVLFLVGAVAFPLTKYLFGFHKSCQFTPDRGKVDIVCGWWDGGYLFSKAVGMAVVTWIVYATGTLRLLPFTLQTILIALFLVFIGGVSLSVFGSQLSDFGQSVFSQSVTDKRKTDKLSAENRQQKTDNWISTVLIIILEELFFFLALLFWSWVKGHEPSIRGLEKFMDYGFMQSVLNSRFFPPADMWYAGHTINYYYFGHMVVAVLTKLSGLDLAYTFNFMLATIFALTLTMSFSIGYQLIQIQKTQNDREAQKNLIIRQSDIQKVRRTDALSIPSLLNGILTSFLVTMAGNMQTIYAFTRGYTGDNVKPFWQLLWPISEFWQKLPEGMHTYWYANATRFIPFTIHEFPSYSFVVSDIHGHVLSIPFVLLAIALLVTMSLRGDPQYPMVRDDVAISMIQRLLRRQNGLAMTRIVFYGFLVGVLLMTNALDGPIYLALLGAVLVIQNSCLAGRQAKFKIQNLEWWKDRCKTIGLVVVMAGLTSLPFLYHFKSFVNGLAINCPPQFLANSKFGPFIFEGVEKCQHSPLWMMALLWGFFVYCGGWLIIKIGRIGHIGHIRHIWDTKITQIEKLLVILFLFSIALIIFPEFFYFKDIYPAHFRSNTMFKLGYQAFILFSIVSAYSIVRLISSKLDTRHSKLVFTLFLLPLLVLVSIYPYFSVRSYFGELREYKGLNGLEWLAQQYPDDWAGIEWMKRQTANGKRQTANNAAKKSFPFTVYRLPSDRFAIVEADGDSYTDSGRFSAFTGIPTIIGWPVHEWLWRGSYDVVAPRREEVRKIYESADVNETKQILEKYHVRYIIVGTLERQKYQQLHEEKFRGLGSEVFRSGQTAIYRVLT